MAGTIKFSKSQENDTLDYFSKFRIYNCIIVSQEHYLKEKVHSRQMKNNDVDTDMEMVVHNPFPYQSSDRCTEVNDITILDSLVISAQGHFTKNTDLFPRKVSNSLNRCPMKAVVRDGNLELNKMNDHYKYLNGNVVRNNKCLKYDLLLVVLQKMNVTYVRVPKPEGFEMRKINASNLVRDMFTKETYIALRDAGNTLLSHTFFDSTSSYFIVSMSWYVPCSAKYTRWKSILKILSVELWLDLIMSIALAAISITLVGRYSSTSEWQGYKTLTRSLANVWAVFLGVSVSTMPRAPSLRSLFLAWVCFCLAFRTVIQSFLTTFLIQPGYETPIKNMGVLFASGIKFAYLPEYSFIF